MTIPVSGRSFKAANFKWLCALVGGDAVILLAFVFPDVLNSDSLSRLAIARALLTAVLPVVVLLLSNLFSPDLKSSLVYWKGKEALPGNEAFTKHGPRDRRVDMVALKNNVGDLPIKPEEQNTFWYKLYKEVDAEVSVVEAHRSYLLFRDMAAMSVLLVLFVPLGLYFNGVTTSALWVSAALFSSQYLASAIASRNNGVRFVTNVLVAHALRKVTAPKTTD